mgnify:CR=1 FL=1
MTPDLIAVGPSDRTGRARDLLMTLALHALPVMDGNDVVGIVTTSDLVDDWPDDEPVSTIMSTAPHTIAAEAGFREAVDVMIDRRIHHLLVESDGEVIGILSSLDLLHLLATHPSQPFTCLDA